MTVERAVRLDDEDWQRVLAILAKGPWEVVNPLIMAIGGQLRAQAEAAPRPAPEEDRATRQ